MIEKNLNDMVDDLFKNEPKYFINSSTKEKAQSIAMAQSTKFKMPEKKMGLKYRKQTEVNDLVRLLEVDQSVIQKTKSIIKNNPKLIAKAQVQYIEKNEKSLAIGTKYLVYTEMIHDDPICKSTEVFAK